MSNLSVHIDIIELFKKQFGSKPYLVPGLFDSNNGADNYQISPGATKAEKEFTAKGHLLKEHYNGVEILLPVRFFYKDRLIYMPYCVISISGDKAIIRTQLSERQGSVKEQFNIDDYKITIKGFLIGAHRKFPEDELYELRELFETRQAVTIDNALTNIFLSNPDLPWDEQRRVVITGFNIPEVSGGKEHVRPFTMNLESDTVFTLELE